MAALDPPEVWLRGPVPGISSLLQPVAHALLQAQEEVHKIIFGFPELLLWERPAGVASVGFHLQHLTGVLDRLFTYARGESLTPAQLDRLRSEEQSPGPTCSAVTLVENFPVFRDLDLIDLYFKPRSFAIQIFSRSESPVSGTLILILPRP